MLRPHSQMWAPLHWPLGGLGLLWALLALLSRSDSNAPRSTMSAAVVPAVAAGGTAPRVAGAMMEGMARRACALAKGGVGGEAKGGWGGEDLPARRSWPPAVRRAPRASAARSRRSHQSHRSTLRPTTPPAIRNTQERSEALGSTQEQSEAVWSSQEQSGAVRSTPWPNTPA